MYLIYKITNTINNKIYIGQTSRSISQRFLEHCRYSKCIKLHNAIKKYGKINFKIETIIISSFQKIADYWEIYFIEKFKSLDRKYGYNLREGGIKGKFNNKGRKHTPEELRKMSENQKGRIFSKETKLKMSEAQKGKIPWNKGKHSIINQYVKYPKLTKEQINSIKNDSRASRLIAFEYGVSKTTILRIKKC